MAPHIESSSVRVTITNGRIHRFEQKFRPQSTKPAKKLNPRVCLLTARAAKALEHWGISHPCTNGGHPHFSRARIDELVATGEVRYLDGQNIAAWKQARHLAVRHSGPVTCVQLVDVGR